MHQSKHSGETNRRTARSTRMRGAGDKCPMAIIIHCPYCHEPLPEMRQECPHCQRDLPAGVVYALAAAFGAPHQPAPFPQTGPPPAHLQEQHAAVSAPRPIPPPVAESSRLRPCLAATLSLCCGLGQLYNGQIVKGMLLMILATAALVSLPMLIGKLLIPCLWSYAIIDAFLVARRRTAAASSRPV